MSRQIDLSNDEIKEILADEYTRDNFDILVDHLLPDFTRNQEEMTSSKFISCVELGLSKTLNLRVYEVMLPKEIQNRRIEITQEMFRLLKRFSYENALVAFVNEDFQNYRLSLLTTEYKDSEDGSREKILSNPHRYSYRLGIGTKTKTVYEYLYARGGVKSLEELKNRFSVDIVNKDFYSKVAESFTKLIGGSFSGKKYPRVLRFSEDVPVNKYSEFGVRLLGRLIFCWFLKEKKSENGKPLVPDILFDDSLVNRPNGNYYNDILQTLFFEILNTPWDKRDESVNNEYFNSIPYLNGGLFSPHHDDFYDGIGSQNVYIPNNWFEKLFETLKQYNFTVDESTSYDVELSIDPEMLGRIFENLLAEINPETGESARKSTGSFYTPRDIVDFMVNTSLYENLVNATDVKSSKIETLIKYGDNEEVTFDDNERKQIVDSLYNIKILDPACGSGAFPMGLLQKIVYILQEIDPDNILWLDKIENDPTIDEETKKQIQWSSIDYARKLLVIKNSIYGVDIQPIASEISRLRCFLSIIIEEKIDDNLPNRGIRPLPNLDFKFAIGNTLVPLENEEDKLSLFDDYDLIEELNDIRKQWFTADFVLRGKLKEQIAKLQSDMISNISGYQNFESQKYKRLSKWNPSSSDENEWFDSEWMFGVEKFDIVIGNPPYIHFDTHKDLSKFYESYGYKTYNKKGDIYCLFYEKGLDLLKKGGVISYITSNTWLRSFFGENLRKFIATQDPIILIDFGDEQIFETATVYTNILICLKKTYEKNTYACLATKDCRNDLCGFLKQHNSVCDFSKRDVWSILESDSFSIKQKISNIGISLGSDEWNLDISYGIKLGRKEAYTITEKERRDLIKEDPESAELIKPILSGSNIKKYKISPSGSYFLCIHNGDRENGIKPVDVRKYPAVKNRLDKYSNDLEERKNRGNSLYNITYGLQYLEKFKKDKIFYREISDEMNACICRDEIYINNKAYVIIGNYLEYLCCFLNSKLFTKFIQIDTNTTGGKGKAFLSKVTLPLPKDNSVWISLYNQIEKDPDNPNLLKKIDMLIYDVFELSEDEINYIESL